MKKGKKVVVQDFNLINARYKLTTNEIKFIMTALSQVNSIEDEILKDYEIKVSDFENMTDSEQNITRLKQFSKKLMMKPLELPASDGWLVVNWFSDIEYVHSESKFLVRFSEKLKPYLLNIKKRFVAYDLKNILALSSGYSIRIYQLLKEYEKFGKRTFELEELQDILSVPSSFKAYGNFNEKVLKVAVKDLFEHSDIYFDIEEIKEGRKVIKLVFRIHKRAKKEITKPIEKPKDYSHLLGINCEVLGVFCDHLQLVTPLNDGSLNCKFSNGKQFVFKNEKNLLSYKVIDS